MMKNNATNKNNQLYRSYDNHKAHYQSVEQQKMLNRSSDQNSHQGVIYKGKVRYKTQEDEKNESSQNLSKGYLMKRNNFRRTKNN